VSVGAEAAKLLGAKVTLVHVMDVEPNLLVGLGVAFGASPAVMPPDVLTGVKQEADAALQALIDQHGIDGDHRVVGGVASEAIVRAAHELHADMIVIGTSGRSGLARLALGSTAEEVASSAPCSVLVVRA
jgi:nucleotide-binding universal stress UspA family protein